MKKRLVVLITLVMIFSVLFGLGAASRREQAVDQEDADITWKDEVVIGVQSRTTTTNPTEAANIAHSLMFKLTHNSLTAYDETTQEIIPRLATSWSLADDKRTWTFTLRDDVFFHNGEKMTSDDWLFTIEYGKNATNGTIRAFYQAIESANAPDENTLEITLVRPNMDLLITLAEPFYSVLNRKAVMADASNGPSIGTGAWVNTRFASGDYTRLDRFDDYWGELPITKTLRFRLIPEGSARLIALENGEVHVCQAPNFTELDFIKANENLELITYQTSALTYLAFNTQSEIASDNNLRLAIAYALNVQDVIDGAVSGMATPARSMWGFNQFGYFDDWGLVDLENYHNNIAKAKEYMAKSNYPNGVTIPIMTSTMWRVNALQIVQQQLLPLGVKLVIDEVDAAGLSSRSSQGNYEVLMFSIAFSTAGNDARRIYDPGMASNHAKYSNARVIELLDLATTESDVSKREEYYKEIQIIAHKECPYIPLYYANSGVGIVNNLEGAVFSVSGSHDYTYVKVAETNR